MRPHSTGPALARLDRLEAEGGDETIPPLDAAWFARALAHDGGKPADLGRAPANDHGRIVPVRLPSAVIEHFRVGAPGWEDRIGQALLALVEARGA